jgi:dienelactone hydrolase
MAIVTRTVDYFDGELRLEGYLAIDDAQTLPRPGVLVAHTWAGRGQFEMDKARELAGIGYAGFALDLYGGGVVGKTPEENRARMQVFLDDRALLARRMTLALEAMGRCPEVDQRRTGAIGFCFGGLCVLDLARSGTALGGVVSFHGLLQPPPQRTEQVRCKVLVLNGHDDPWVPAEHRAALAEELTAAGADWQLHDYGGTLHAFTNPAANSPEAGALYNRNAAQRAWQSMRHLFAEAM